MKMTPFRFLAAPFVILVTLAFLPQRADAVSYGVNLIVNGNAESGGSSSTGSPIAVPGWTTSGAFTVIPYGAPNGYPAPGDPGPPDRANQFFAGGNAALSTATQEIDLSANAADVNAGMVIFNLTGYFGGRQNEFDNAMLTATFFNGTTNLGAVTTGDVTPPDRSGATGLLERCTSGIVPAGATKVVLTLMMTRFAGTSNDGYADSLSFVCTLGTGTTTNSSIVQNGTTDDSAHPVWSDAARWSPAQVPNNCSGNFYNVTLNGLTLSGKLSNEDRIITLHLGEVSLDTTTTISNLTMVDAGLRIDGGGGPNSQEHILTVTGTTTDQTIENRAEHPGFVLFAYSAQASLSLGHFTNLANGTLSGTFFFLSSFGPAATVRFNGADILTLNARVTLSGANAQILDENGLNGLRNLAVIGPEGALQLEFVNYVHSGDLTVNGILQITGLGDSSITVQGALKNFDPATRTLTGGIFAADRYNDTSTEKVTLRFSGADIVNNAAVISLFGPNSHILDQNGNNGLRNLAHNLASGDLFFIDQNFTSAGAFTNDGQLRVRALGQPTTFTVTGSLTNFDPATRTVTGGIFSIRGSLANSVLATLKFPNADIVHNASEITLGGLYSITDLAGNNALRNFVDNTSAGFLELVNTSFTAPADFTNAGTVWLSNLDPSPTFTVAAGHNYIQTGGDTSLFGSVLKADNVIVQGGILHHGGTINGNVDVQRGTIAPTTKGGGGTANLGGYNYFEPASVDFQGPGKMTINGNLNLATDAHLGFVIRKNTANEFDTMQVSGSAKFGGTLNVTLLNGFMPGPNDSFTVLTAGSPISGSFLNAANGARFPTTDGRGSFIATYSNNQLVLSNFETKPPAQLLNISTRMRVLTDNNVLIAGFIITGTDPKKVIIRGLGPSLGAVGVQGALTNTTLELFQGSTRLAANDDWKIDDGTGQSQEATIAATTIPPSHDLESALIATLSPGAYTAILSGRNQTTGIGVVEVYDLEQAANSKLANISTRGFVDTGDNAMIGGFIVGGSGGGAARVIVRGLGPSIPVSGTLSNPILELFDGNGGKIASDDNWKDSQETDINATTIPPSNDAESAIVRTLVPGNYTAVMRGVNNSTGIGLIEVYNLP